jgi:RHS repeat-associated protein
MTGISITNGPEHEIQSYSGVTYGYINDEHLSSATTGSTSYSMVYDALGRCVKRSLTGGPATYYIYDGEKPILEYGTGWVSAGVNVYGKGIDEILERVAVGSDGQWHTYFPQQNHEDSVTLLTDGAGNAIERYRYDAFGAPTIYNGSGAQIAATAYDNRFLFTGREYAATYRSTYNVPAFTFYEYRARAYNTTLGRFMSEDPKLFDAGDYNLFRYCHNDPIDFTDPMGLDMAGPAPTSTIEREDYYNRAMARAQWVGSDLMHNATGAMGIGMAGYAYAQQTTVTGQLKGSLANPALLKNAKPGDANDRDAPTGLEITNKVDERGHYKQHHLQVKNDKGIWKGIGVAEEHVKPMGGNLGPLKTSGPTLFGNGDVVDRVGLWFKPGPNVTGYLLNQQTYRLYYPTPDGMRYVDLGVKFWQYTNVYRGQVTNADLGYWGH